jgi:DNA-binding MarR family transcriptional regulator
MGAVTSIMRAQQVLLARLNDVLKPVGLTFPRYEALMVLHYSRRGSLSLGRLGDRLQVHRATVTSLVDRLEAQGLVKRLHQQRDRRTILAEITPEGRRVAELATRDINAASFVVGALADDHLEQLYGLLRPLRAA